MFEGINFMSRNPTMTEEELAAMHARAEKAGMYPYGASPEQMHTVARRPQGALDVDNSWQAMWRFIGVDKLLQLLTESNGVHRGWRKIIVFGVEGIKQKQCREHRWNG